MIIALLIIIVLLLIGVTALLLTGWTLYEKNDIERTGQDIRRELAQHRADTVQLLHSMRIELEESLREAFDQKFDTFEVRQSRASTRRRRSPAVSRDANAGLSSGSACVDDETEDENAARILKSCHEVPCEDDRQFQLFPEVVPEEKALTSVEEQMRSLLEHPKPEAQVFRASQPAEVRREKDDDDEYISMIRVLPAADLYDDIPEVGNLPELQGPETDSDTVPDPKTIRLRTAGYIDDIPDVDDL